MKQDRNISHSYVPKGEPFTGKLIEKKALKLTSHAAEALLYDFGSFEGEREITDEHVQELLNFQKARRFDWNNVQIVTAEMPDGTKWRINGGHTLTMRLYLTKEEEGASDFIVSYLHYAVPNRLQLKILYTMYDNGKPRSYVHLGKALVIGEASSEGIGGSYLGHITSGFKLWQFNGDKSLDVNDVAAIINEQYAALYNRVGKYVVSYWTQWPEVRRAAVIGAMMATFNKSAAIGPEFWTPVVSGLSLNEKTDPRWFLRKYIEHHSHGARTPGKDTVTSEEMYRICIACWNYYRQDKPARAVRAGEKRVQPI